MLKWIEKIEGQAQQIFLYCLCTKFDGEFQYEYELEKLWKKHYMIDLGLD
jgi:hypothetical protein